MNSKPTEGAYRDAFVQSRNRFQARVPESMTRASLCAYNEPAARFEITSLGHAIAVSYPEGNATFLNTGERLPLGWALIVLNHLSSARARVIAGDWVSFADLPQGRVFNANIKMWVYKPLAQFYEKSARDVLRRALAELSFADCGMTGDLAMQGHFAPRVPVALQFWEGEDEIPPACQILFDRTISEQMHTEDIAALCGVVKNVLLQQYAQVYS